jgi:hypothetical protein
MGIQRAARWKKASSGRWGWGGGALFVGMCWRRRASTSFFQFEDCLTLSHDDVLEGVDVVLSWSVAAKAHRSKVGRAFRPRDNGTAAARESTLMDGTAVSLSIQDCGTAGAC